MQSVAIRMYSVSLVCFPLIGLVAIACSDAEIMCDCATAGITVLATRGDVVAISTGGAACSGGSVICVSSSDQAALVGCQQWIVSPVGAGTCQIDVSMRDGSTRSAEFEIVNRTESCCSGLYATGNGTFVVAGPDAAAPVDAGGD